MLNSQLCNQSHLKDEFRDLGVSFLSFGSTVWGLVHVNEGVASVQLVSERLAVANGKETVGIGEASD